jgi:phenylacetate-CoA ligase
MDTWALRLYHALPHPARTAAATMCGYYLRSWRYGEETERLVGEARERETWTVERWKTWQGEQLAATLDRAASMVPHYREQWRQRQRRGDRASHLHLENWPLLTKDVVRDHPRRLVADDCDVGDMFHEHTSGTSGTPLDLWWSRATVRSWYALFEARCRLWYGVSRHDRWGILGGQLIVPAARRTPPFWVWNGALNQLYLSSYHLAPGLIEPYLDAIAKYGVAYLWGYTSSLYALAIQALRLRKTLQLKVVITNAEPLYSYQRQAIAEAFGCPVRETYGMAEIVTAASECAAGRLHIWPEVGVVDVATVGGERSGPMVCTGLLNRDMPLIRYVVGDHAVLPRVESPCPCGRTLPTISALEGRDDDVLYTRDGRRIGRLDPAFKTSLPVTEAQIIQETLEHIRVRYVPAPGFSPDSARALRAQLRTHLGPVEVTLEAVDEVPRTAGGKFRAVVSRLSGEERSQVAGG